MKDEINIGTITDSNYTQHTGVMMFSMMKNCSKPSKLHFYIMDGGIDEKGKNILREICKDFKAKISFVKPDLSVFNGLKIGAHLTPIIYAKLLFPTLIKGVNKIIVMDSDIIVEGDINELFTMPLNGKILGAVPDGCVELQESCKKNLGMNPENEYFNSGVMLVDSSKWKKNKVLQKVMKFIK